MYTYGWFMLRQKTTFWQKQNLQSNYSSIKKYINFLKYHENYGDCPIASMCIVLPIWVCCLDYFSYMDILINDHLIQSYKNSYRMENINH